ncbi:hypothetical protein TNCV_2600721 [Trichonephila clavipes]|nr:hypothetical protein TNCV_2600721 [Trichonephila clavipes]
MKFIASKGLVFTPVVSLSFEHHASDTTIFLGFTPVLTENILGVVRGLPPLFPFHQPHERDSTAIRRPSCHEGTIHLQISMPSPGFEPRPYGTAISATNHCTGWVAKSTYNGV